MFICSFVLQKKRDTHIFVQTHTHKTVCSWVFSFIFPSFSLSLFFRLDFSLSITLSFSFFLPFFCPSQYHAKKNNMKYLSACNHPSEFVPFTSIVPLNCSVPFFRLLYCLAQLVFVILCLLCGQEGLTLQRLIVFIFKCPHTPPSFSQPYPSTVVVFTQIPCLVVTLHVVCR